MVNSCNKGGENLDNPTNHVNNPANSIPEKGDETIKGTESNLLSNLSIRKEYIEEHPEVIEGLGNISEEQQIVLVTLHEQAIYYLIQNLGHDPSEAVQVAAVTAYPFAIYYIEHPCDKAQIIAVKRTMKAADWIHCTMCKEARDYYQKKRIEERR